MKKIPTPGEELRIKKRQEEVAEMTRKWEEDKAAKLKADLDAFRVKDLVAHLLTGDQEARVLVSDHFGQPIPLSPSDFTFVESKGSFGNYLRVSAVDIGPDPE
jgi:hypothetical protein